MPVKWLQWLQTVPLESAVQEIGLFGNQNPVCKPTALGWRSTVERLKQKFTGFDKDGAAQHRAPGLASRAVGSPTS